MATVVLSAAGAAIGGSVGGTLAGLSSVAIGRAVGATVGRLVDQRLLGQGSESVETGKVDRFRLNNAGEGDPIARTYGRMRMSGQIIWASDFVESVTTTGGGGKGNPSQPTTNSYSYSVSLAIGLCEGEILGIGRIWADGREIAKSDLNLRIYNGSRDQLPDPTMEAIEGQGQVPAYRGTAYVVLEDLQLGEFGNRVPQFSFEVLRAEQERMPRDKFELSQSLKGVAMMPGTGEYALATTPVTYSDGGTGRWSANINSPSGLTDFSTSLASLGTELPKCEAVSLIVSWFGSDLRMGRCEIKPKMERRSEDGMNMPWTVSGLARSQADEIAQSDGRPIYGGTPADAAVVEAIQAMNASSKAVMFYPFILMDQLEGNSLPDPYSETGVGQPKLPWRGRITLDKAPNVAGSPDGSAAADLEIDTFFGSASATDFLITPQGVTYTGSDEWTFSRFILHYAALCAYAGGVEAFCIGSELRGITQARGANGRFSSVSHLIQLAREVRQILGPDVKISYAADWSEYFGYQPQDGSGDRYFHLDPLWADPDIDFIGIDNYMPLSDWRDGEDHADAAWNAIYNIDYLKSNIMGGEGFDWYYSSSEAEAAQIRTPITDAAHNEPWIWRYKDLLSWWEKEHFERVGGVRGANPTEWIPRSKPFWFTEFGCAAIDKGTNQPNKFLDPKSSESQFPKYSNGGRDDLIQKHYYLAMQEYWSDATHNPVSDEYGGRMVNMDRAFAWAWDARPYPFFPNLTDQWSDGDNYARGHWLNGRVTSRTLASVVDEICDKAGLTERDTRELYGLVRGYTVDQMSDARAMLQPLMLRYGFDAIERGGKLVFKNRTASAPVTIDRARVALTDEIPGSLQQTRDSTAELSGRVRLRFIEADGDFDTVSEEAILPDEQTQAVSASDLALSMTRGEGRQVADRWLSEARIARDSVRFALPPSMMSIGAGDTVTITDATGVEDLRYRIDSVEQGNLQILEGVRVEPSIYTSRPAENTLARIDPFVAPVPLTSLFLDIPLVTGDEVPHAPRIAVSGSVWPGSAAIYQSADQDGFQLNTLVQERATIGVTRSILPSAAASLFDRGPALEVELISGSLSSASLTAVLNGANLAAIGNGSADHWELFQFNTAELVSPGRYLLSGRLRGQLGTEHLSRVNWPTDSWFVLLNSLPPQVELPSSLRRVAQTFRVGPASRPFDDPTYTETQIAFDGIGLRPYAPVHLSVDRGTDRFEVTWTRRTRVDGDPWDNVDVPLGEENESYLVLVRQAGVLIRENVVNSPSWIYPDTVRSSDGLSGAFQVSVAQISARFGPGVSASKTIAP